MSTVIRQEGGLRLVLDDESVVGVFPENSLDRAVAFEVVRALLDKPHQMFFSWVSMSDVTKKALSSIRYETDLTLCGSNLGTLSWPAAGVKDA